MQTRGWRLGWRRRVAVVLAAATGLAVLPAASVNAAVTYGNGRIAFGFSNLGSVAADGNARFDITTTVNDSNPDWSPDG